MTGKSGGGFFRSKYHMMLAIAYGIWWAIISFVVAKWLAKQNKLPKPS